MWWLAVLSCQCGPPAPPAPMPGHYPEFGALVRATARGDLAAAKTIAGDLSSVLVARSPTEEDALADLAGATGFLRTAEDGDDLAFGVVRIARSCGACHATTPSPPLTVTGHAVDESVVHPLVWPAAPAFVPPDAEDAPSRAIRAAVTAPPADTATGVPIPARRALSACQTCHSP